MGSTVVLVKTIVLVCLVFSSIIAGLMPLLISGAISLFYRISLRRDRDRWMETQKRRTSNINNNRCGDDDDDDGATHMMALSSYSAEHSNGALSAPEHDYTDFDEYHHTMMHAMDTMQENAKRSETRVQTTVMKVLDLCQGFAGGVLLAAGLMHLLPEASEVIANNLALLFGHSHDEDGDEHEHNTMMMSTMMNGHGHAGHDHGGEMWFVHYPWGPALLCCSLFILIFVEDVLVKLFVSAPPPSSTKGAAAAAANDELKQHLISNEPNNLIDDRVSIPIPDPMQSSQELELIPNQAGASDPRHTDTNLDQTNKKSTALQQQIQASQKVAKMIVSGVVLWISLTLHSLFEGLALGTQTDERKMWSIFVAIVSHKLVESFALGLILKDSFKGKKTFIMILLVLIFSMATPLGIGVGIAVSTIENSWFLVIQSAMLAFSCGAFIHVALEILRGHSHFPDHEHGGHGHAHSHAKNSIMQHLDNLALLVKYGLFVLGWLVMAVLSIWAH